MTRLVASGRQGKKLAAYLIAKGHLIAYCLLSFFTSGLTSSTISVAVEMEIDMEHALPYVHSIVVVSLSLNFNRTIAGIYETDLPR